MLIFWPPYLINIRCVFMWFYQDSTTETSTSDDSNNSFNVSTASSSKKRSPRTTSAHFYWVTREAGSFEWFKGVMDEVAGMDKKVSDLRFSCKRL